MATSTINNPNIYTKVWTVDLDSVSSANGAYSHSTTVPKMTTDYKPILFECDDPSIFKDTVNVSTGQNTVTLSCNNAIGSTTGVKASFVLQGDADTLSSAEYQALGSRIGNLNNLNTDDKGSIVEAINELNTIECIFTQNNTMSATTDYTLDKSLENFSILVIYARDNNTNSATYTSSTIMIVNDIIERYSMGSAQHFINNANANISFGFKNATTLAIRNLDGLKIYKIYGIK